MPRKGASEEQVVTSRKQIEADTKSLPSDSAFPVRPDRLRTFLEDAQALLGIPGIGESRLELGSDPHREVVLIIRLNALPQAYGHRLDREDSPTSAQDEKRAAKKIRQYASKLAEALDGQKSPRRLYEWLGFSLGGLSHSGAENPAEYTPDPKWQVRRPVVIEELREHLQILAVLAETFETQPRTGLRGSALEWLMGECEAIAAKVSKTQEDALSLAKLAHKAVTGKEPETKEGDWGQFHLSHRRKSSRMD